MAEVDWAEFLRRWSQDMLASPFGRELPADVRASGWLGFAPASEEQIASVERRLGIALPPSYRAFLRVSNGWRRTGAAIDRIWGTEEVQWFRKRHRDWIAAFTEPLRFGPREQVPDDEYFAYEQWAEHFRTPHLKETLQISEVGDSAVYLLNPQVIRKDGEWEAWFFANWLPGVHRYRSFIEMMQAQYHLFAGLDWQQPTGIQDGLPDEYVGSPGSPKRRVKPRRPRPVPKVLGRRFDAWKADELLAMLENKDYDIIYDEIVAGLGMLGDRRAVKRLIALALEDGAGSCAALYALRKLARERLPELLLDILRRRQPLCSAAAATLLREMRDMRAVPILAEIARDTDPSTAHFADIAGVYLAEFGEMGFAALIELAQSEMASVRRRSVAGLAHVVRPVAADTLRKLLHDPEPMVRQMAQGLLALPQHP